MPSTAGETKDLGHQHAQRQDAQQKTMAGNRKLQLPLYTTLSALQCGYCYRGHPDKVNQSQNRTRTIDSNIFYFSQ